MGFGAMYHVRRQNLLKYQLISILLLVIAVANIIIIISLSVSTYYHLLSIAFFTYLLAKYTMWRMIIYPPLIIGLITNLVILLILLLK